MASKSVSPGEVLTMLECAKLDLYFALREATVQRQVPLIQPAPAGAIPNNIIKLT